MSRDAATQLEEGQPKDVWEMVFVVENRYLVRCLYRYTLLFQTLSPSHCCSALLIQISIDRAVASCRHLPRMARLIQKMTAQTMALWI